MSSQLRIIDGATIRRLAPPDKLIGWMREAMIAVSRREVELPLRRALVLPGEMGAVGMMPGYVGAEVNSAGVKLVSLVPPARRKGSSHLGLMVLYDADGLVHNIKFTSDMIRTIVDNLAIKIQSGVFDQKEVLEELEKIKTLASKALKISELITRANFKTKALSLI